MRSPSHSVAASRRHACMVHASRLDSLQVRASTHEHRRHRIDRLRLPDVVSREVHRALPAGAHVARQPELSRRHDGQAARRLRAEHRLHAGAARRAAAADGDGRAGLRRLPPLARGGRRRHVAGASRSPDKFTASFFCSTDADEQPDRVVLHRRDGQRRRAVVPDGAGLRPGDHLAERSRARWCSTPRSAGRSAFRTSSIRVSSARACRARSWQDGLAGAAIVICNDYEFELIRQKTGLDEADDPGAHAARWSSPAARTGARSLERRRQVGRAGRARPHRIVDPTGVGDAFRGGFLKGHGARRRYPVCAQHRQRGGDLRARAPRGPEPRLHVGGVPRTLSKRTSARRRDSSRVKCRARASRA